MPSLLAEYWLEKCKCGDGKTNLECVKEAADNTRTPLIEAMRVFRPNPNNSSFNEWTGWGQ